VRDDIFTAEARDLLKDLGVDYRRETEMVHSHRIARGRHAYDGWFHLFGTIESGRDAYAARGELFARELEPLTDALSFGFTSRVRGAAPPFDAGPVLELEVAVIAPWVLEIEEPS
jgi:hypothetical protein